MSKFVKLIAGAALLGGVAASGYWYGAQHTDVGNSASAPAARKLLYYRNPMGLPDTSPVPKKDAMGMDYVPVYEGEESSSAIVNIDPAKVQKLGVRSEAAAKHALAQTLRLNGRIEVDEKRIRTVAPKFEGWVERLHVNTSGQGVRQGQPLFDVYSPELVSALREQALAAEGLAALQDADEDARADMQRLADASAARLKNWGIAAGQPDHERLTFHAPVGGVVLEKKVVQGMRFMPGEELFRIADLSSVWVVADVAEQDLAQLRIGSRADITTDAWPGRRFAGKVEFIYPTLDPATRTVPLRVVIANADALLKPGMFVQASIAAATDAAVLSVPHSAVIDSGQRQVVLVQLAEGRYEPREVHLGRRGDAYVEVLSGVAEGERVVSAANFLIDAESNLKAALGGLHAPAPSAAALGTAGISGIGHRANGVLEGINPDGTLSITHEPIPALGWPAMTMDFTLAHSALAQGLAPGNAISFEIVERKAGDWMITKLNPRTPQEDSHAEHNH